MNLVTFMYFGGDAAWDAHILFEQEKELRALYRDLKLQGEPDGFYLRKYSFKGKGRVGEPCFNFYCNRCLKNLSNENDFKLPFFVENVDFKLSRGSQWGSLLLEY